MNDWDIFGEVLINVPAPQLVNEGHILPPKLSSKILMLLTIVGSVMRKIAIIS